MQDACRAGIRRSNYEDLLKAKRFDVPALWSAKYLMKIPDCGTDAWFA
jgi:hypothetical protein